MKEMFLEDHVHSWVTGSVTPQTNTHFGIIVWDTLGARTTSLHQSSQTKCLSALF